MSSEASLLTRVNPFHARGAAAVALALGVDFHLPAQRLARVADAYRAPLSDVVVGEGVHMGGRVSRLDAKVTALDAAVDEKFRGTGIAYGRSVNRRIALATHGLLRAVEMRFVTVGAADAVARGSLGGASHTEHQASNRSDAKWDSHGGFDSL